MGVLCKVRLYRPPNGIFVPGGVVAGIINYSVDSPLPVKSIVVSLNGVGRVLIEEKQNKQTVTYVADENYVTIEHNMLGKQSDYTIPVGSHEIPFKFVLPLNIPASFNYAKSRLNRFTVCKIGYFVVIRFARPGILNFDKKYQQELVVVRGIAVEPRRPTELMIHGDKKKLTQFLKNNSVKLKAIMPTSVIPHGGTVRLEYEVENDSNLEIKSVKAIMMEMLTFTTGHLEEKHYKEIPNTETTSGPIAARLTEKVPISMTLPQEAISYEYSNIVCRDYVIMITVVLPWPHRNLIVQVPFQVGNKPTEGNTEPEVYADSIDSDDDYDSPPSYWEAMAEVNDNAG